MGTRESIYFKEDGDGLLEWIEQKVDEGRFANKSHAVRFCVRKAKEQGIEEYV